MPGVARRLQLKGSQITNDVALHLQEHCNQGVAVVIAEKPIAFLSTLRKHWIRHQRSLQRQRASTINPEKIVAITTKIACMFNMRFSASQKLGAADIYVLPPNFDRLPEGTKIIYVCCPILPQQQELFPPAATIIRYTN